MFKILIQESINEASSFVVDDDDDDENCSKLKIQTFDFSLDLKQNERLALLFQSPVKIFNILLNLFDFTFKKCQSIYVNAKLLVEEDDKASTKPLSQANVETHNQQQIAEQTLLSTSGGGGGGDETKIYSEQHSIKDIDASSDDDSDFLLAAVFDEQVHNTTINTSFTNDEISSTNSTQIIDSVFELDSNKAYSQVRTPLSSK